jgi:hypothetical protein
MRLQLGEFYILGIDRQVAKIVNEYILIGRLRETTEFRSAWLGESFRVLRLTSDGSLLNMPNSARINMHGRV